MAQENISLVITSIAAPNDVLKSYAALCKQHQVNYIVIGDTKSPANFFIEGCQFLSIEQQKQVNESFASLLPVKHYARKNIGYLLAMQQGATVIIETDDDNFATEHFFNFFPKQTTQPFYEANGEWVNVYRYFTDKKIWPRGLPLDRILDTAAGLLQAMPQSITAPIQQGLANDNPDVDAVYRLVSDVRITFDANKQIVLGKHTWCPFNSQNTVWYAEAFPLLYLPSYCSFRMTDIWRSFIAQRIAWENNWQLLFYSPTVWQERNVHNLMRDFEDEIPGYLHNENIRQTLESLSLKSGVVNIGDNLKKCYDVLIQRQYIGEAEMPLLEAWLKALQG
ncbi:STELLO glycosyltransferase family protein [Hydrotalea sp.]|uniref:STELLO glycosyltransferase family protein n=1 Tax=Hydrotalea sp. TaxID=2881279 RepID=UPI00262BE876|nr:STELLO glycosyltransferase family protein [Hydrotalea sp.]